MIRNSILWSQKANSKSNTIRNFSYFLYEFIGARFTILAFLGLFNVAAYQLDVFGQVLTIGISIFLYYIISDAFSVFWTGINLEYFVENDKIVFQWGVTRQHELEIPFDKITKISAVYGGKEKRSAIIFANSEKIKNGDYGFSKEILFNQLSFENVVNIKKLILILNKISGRKVEKVKEDHFTDWTEKSPTSSLYLKFIQLLAFILLYLSTSVGLKLIDNNLLQPILVQDVIIEQKDIVRGKDQHFNLMKTKDGYRIKLRNFMEYKGEKVKFYVSPLFNDVTKFESFKVPSYESLHNGYMGVYVLFKILALISTLFSTSYIFYKRGFVPFVDLSICLLFPLGTCSVAFLLFN